MDKIHFSSQGREYSSEAYFIRVLRRFGGFNHWPPKAVVSSAMHPCIFPLLAAFPFSAPSVLLWRIVSQTKYLQGSCCLNIYFLGNLGKDKLCVYIKARLFEPKNSIPLEFNIFGLKLSRGFNFEFKNLLGNLRLEQVCIIYRISFCSYQYCDLNLLWNHINMGKHGWVWFGIRK